MRFVLGLTLLFIASPAAAAPGVVAPGVVVGDEFTFPMPEGWEDISAAVHHAGGPATTVAVAPRQRGKPKPASLFVQRAPVQTRTTDAAACMDIGHTMASTLKAKLEHARMIAGPIGQACQIRLVAPVGVAIITELDAPQATWLMTCNHSHGDAVAEAICASTLAGFKLK